MKKVKVTIELEMTNKYFEDDFAEFIDYLSERKKSNEKDYTRSVGELENITDDKACDVVEFYVDEVEE